LSVVAASAVPDATSKERTAANPGEKRIPAV
jgi:hypothetical protein